MAPAGSPGFGDGLPAGGGRWPQDPPAGDPSSVDAYTYGEDEFLYVGVQWVNGDVLAYTQIGASTVGDPVVFYMAAPGETLAETGRLFNASETIWARHIGGGSPGDWVQAT